MGLSDKIRARLQPSSVKHPATDKEEDAPRPSLGEKLREKARGSIKIGEDEMARICRLPVVRALDGEEIERLNYQWVEASAYEEGFRLFPVQVAAIKAFQEHGGLFAPISVGGGKTLITLKIADLAWHEGIRTSLLIVPSQVYSQLKFSDIPMARRMLSLSVPFFLLGGLSKTRRARVVKAERTGCYVMPYSYLSTEDTNQILNTVQPGLIICDEAHRIKNYRAARTRRLMAYITEHRPLLAVLSGTITSKSIMDYQHLLRYSLGDKSPLPQSLTLAQDWSSVLDAPVTPGEGQLQAFAPLLNWARINFPDKPFPLSQAGVRKAYKERLHSAPGVVASFDSGIGTSLIFHNGEASQPGEDLRSLMDQVEHEWKTPNGDEIEYSIHTFKWLYELSAGFYNELVWPTVNYLQEKRGISEMEAEDLLERALAHHQASQEYAMLLREYLQHPLPGIDTPMLVGRDISKNGSAHVGSTLADAWHAMKALDFEGRPERLSRAVRVDDFKIQAMIQWAKSIKGGALIWVYHQEVGRWAVEALREAGIDPIYAAAGAAGNRAILDPNHQDRIIVASMTAHGEGKNLQAFQQQYFLQWPRSAKLAEQVLGRTHRHGQKADTLVVEMNRTIQFDHIVMAACLTDAIYIQQTTGNLQKLLFGTYDPLPKIYSPEFLREKGAQNETLDEEAKKRLKWKFGEFADKP